MLRPVNHKCLMLWALQSRLGVRYYARNAWMFATIIIILYLLDDVMSMCRIGIKFRSRQLHVRRSSTVKMARHLTSYLESAVKGVATWELFDSKLAPITPSLLVFLSEMTHLAQQKNRFLNPSQTLGGSGRPGRNVAAVVGVVDRVGWGSVN